MFPEKLRAIDLFCGIGGNSWGARDAGLEIVAGFDKWDLAGQMYQDNFPSATFYPGKLQDNSLDDLNKKLGKIDLILASPECTSHSVARGNKEKNRESLELAYQVLRFTEKLQPRWLAIENVTSMKSWDGYQDFLEKLGREYKFLEQPLTASDFGVPQSRRRLFILCDRQKQPEQVLLPMQDRPQTVADILAPDEKYRFSPLVTERRAKNTLTRAQRAIDGLALAFVANRNQQAKKKQGGQNNNSDQNLHDWYAFQLKNMIVGSVRHDGVNFDAFRPILGKHAPLAPNRDRYLTAVMGQAFATKCPIRRAAFNLVNQFASFGQYVAGNAFHLNTTGGEEGTGMSITHRRPFPASLQPGEWLWGADRGHGWLPRPAPSLVVLQAAKTKAASALVPGLPQSRFLPAKMQPEQGSPLGWVLNELAWGCWLMSAAGLPSVRMSAHRESG